MTFETRFTFDGEYQEEFLFDEEGKILQDENGDNFIDDIRLVEFRKCVFDTTTKFNTAFREVV